MNLLKISWANVVSRPLAALLSLVLLSMAVGIISMLVLVNNQFQQQFTNNVKGIDMVLGAKGSPLQLILSSVYHVDAPTGNIPLDKAEKILNNPLVAKKIPLSYGDSYKGYRIVGTEHTLPEKYQMQLKEGRLWEKPFEVTVGATVAKNLGLKLGDYFHSAHGLLDDTHVHDHQDFVVVGLFNESNSVGDQLILTAQESVWNIHAHDGEEAPKEITAMLVKFRSPLGMVQIPRMINEQTAMQAALPSIEVNRLFEQMGLGIFTLQLIAFGIMLVSGISVFVALFNSLRERKYELALMRSMGGSQGQLFMLMLMEGLFLVIIGWLLGTLLSRFGIYLLNNYLSDNFHYNLSALQWVKEEWYLLGACLLLGVFAALIPAIQAARTDIANTLSEG